MIDAQMPRAASAGTRVAVLVGVAASVLLVGCTSGGTTATSTTTPTTNSSRTSVTTTTARPSASALDTCAGYFGDGGQDTLMWRVPDALSQIGPEMDAATARKLVGIGDELEALIKTAPPDLAVHLRATQLPFQQVADSLRGGGGAVRLDTGAARDAILPLTTACVQAGYRVSG